MDLSRLAAPVGEKAVLMVGEGENHEQHGLPEILELCRLFRPDAIAIERDADRTRLEPWRTLGELLTALRSSGEKPDYEALPSERGRAATAMRIAAMYAAHEQLPLYLADWQPIPAESIADFFTGELPHFAGTGQQQELGWKGLAATFEETIGALFGREEMFWANAFIGERLMLESRWDDDAETRGLMRYDLLCLSPQGMALRNEYTAMVLNNIEAERILYVGGAAHFCPRSHYIRDMRIRVDSVIPLQELIDAPHKYYVDLEASRSPEKFQDILDELGAEGFPTRITKTAQPRLEWERLGYWREGFK